MRAFIVAAALIAALAGCGRQESGRHEAANTASGQPMTNFQQAVMNLNDAQRNGVFFRAIQDAGLPCQKVVGSERVADEKEGPAWRAQCDDQSYHLIIVHSDGTAKVVSRTQ